MEKNSNSSMSRATDLHSGGHRFKSNSAQGFFALFCFLKIVFLCALHFLIACFEIQLWYHVYLAFQARIKTRLKQNQRTSSGNSNMWPAERKPTVFAKFWFVIKLYYNILGKTTGSTNNFTHVCIASVQGEITLQSANSIYHTTPQFVRS